MQRVAARTAIRATAFALGFLGLGLGPSAGAEDGSGGERAVEPGRKVSIEFVVTLDDGSIPDTNVGKDPLVFEAGANKILPGLERELVGMKPGERRTIVLTAEKGYGPVRPDLFHAVPADYIPEVAREAGARVIGNDPSGNQVQGRVHEVKGDEIVVDFNHPLAGQKVTFDVKILAVD